MNDPSKLKSACPLFLFLLFCSAFPFVSFSQQFSFRNYSVEDGIAQSQVYALCEDSRGFLWMGTRGGGLNRYDGLNFKTYTERDGLSSNYIFSILEDTCHQIWIGTNNGLSLYDGKHFKNYFPNHDSSEVHVQTITKDKNGVLWLATNKGIYTFRANAFQLFEPCFANQNVLSLFADHTGAVWASSVENGLVRISHNTKTGTREIKSFGKGSGLGKITVQCIQEDHKGHIWVGSFGMGCFAFDGASFVRTSKSTELNKKIVLDIQPDSHGNMWIATLTDGVCKWDSNDSTLVFLQEKEGLSNNHVRCILEDSRGDFWFGTSGGGVSKYYGQPFTHFTKNNGLNSNFVYSVFRDSRDRLWLGTGDKGVCMYDGKSFYPFSAEEGFDNLKVKAIAEDENRFLWLGTDGKGVYVYNEKEFQPIQELHGKYVRCILKDSKQNMWVATAGSGIYKLSPGADKKKKYTVLSIHWDPGSAKNRINCLAEDKKGRIWFGAETNGIGYIENDKVVRTFSQKDKLVSDVVRSMLIDRSGNLWVGTAGSGVSRIELSGDSFRIESINLSDGLTSGNIYLLSRDNENNLILGTESGLDKLKLNPDGHILELKHFGKAEGFSGIETCQNAVFADSNGVIWFGTINGLTAYNSHNKTKNRLAPNIRMSNISLFYQPIEKTAYADYIGKWGEIIKPLVFPYDQNHIGFDFDGINLSSPEHVLFQWKLEGFDKDWSPAGPRHDATYSNLPPGNYTFEFKAANEDGVWNKEPARLHFVILKPFWLKTGFIVLCIVAFLLFAGLLFRWREKVLQKKSTDEKNKLETEKILIELEQKALRLQMNPHFIFNALNSIQASISRNNEETARYYLAKFSKLMRMILEHSGNTLIPIEEEMKVLDDYLCIEKFSSGDLFDYNMRIDPSLADEDISLPPMMIQPFVENSIIHGLKGMEQRGIISIEFCRKGDFLECTVTDNGIGRARAAQNIRAQQDQNHKSTALRVTQERLDILNKETILKSLEIIDLFDASGKACGTKVLIRVPIG